MKACRGSGRIAPLILNLSVLDRGERSATAATIHLVKEPVAPLGGCVDPRTKLDILGMNKIAKPACSFLAILTTLSCTFIFINFMS